MKFPTLKTPSRWETRATYLNILFGVSTLGVFVHGDINFELHHLVEVVDGMLHILRNGAVGERLEVKEASVTPPHGITRLDAQFALHLLEALFVHIRLHGIPCGKEAACLLHTLVIPVAQLVPEGPACLHLVVP